MAALFDVAARLAEGRPAVDDAQTFVTASQARGYQHADLTLHGAQLRDWYSTHDGLDLDALDADAAVLRATAGATAEALRLARAQAAELAGAWSGEGSSAAVDFIATHCAEADALTVAVAQAAAAISTLRDTLWSVVDRKVEAVVSIDDRVTAQRPSWLAAARQVIAGSAEDTAASVVDGQVKPFVQEHLQGDWLAAMRMAIGDTVSAYHSAVSAVEDRRPARFAVPGDLGPRFEIATPPESVAALAATAPPVPRTVVPSVPVAPASAQPVPAPAPPPVAPQMPSNALDPLASAAAPPPLTSGWPGMDMGALPGIGGGTALPSRTADTFGGLPDNPPELPEIDPPEPPDEDPDEDLEEDLEEDLDEDAMDVPEVDTDKPTEEDPGEPDVASDPGPVEESRCPDPKPEPEPPLPPEPEPAAPAPPPPVPATPCEIAADELPNAGE